MVLKYKTNVEHYADGSEATFSQDQWNFIDGIVGASIYFDIPLEATVAVLEFDSKPSMEIVLNHEAYLLNENGKTIEKVRV